MASNETKLDGNATRSSEREDDQELLNVLLDHQQTQAQGRSQVTESPRGSETSSAAAAEMNEDNEKAQKTQCVREDSQGNVDLMMIVAARASASLDEEDPESDHSADENEERGTPSSTASVGTGRSVGRTPSLAGSSVQFFGPNKFGGEGGSKIRRKGVENAVEDKGSSEAVGETNLAAESEGYPASLSLRRSRRSEEPARAETQAGAYAYANLPDDYYPPNRQTILAPESSISLHSGDHQGLVHANPVPDEDVEALPRAQAAPVNLSAAEERKKSRDRLRGRLLLLAYFALIAIGIAVALATQKRQEKQQEAAGAPQPTSAVSLSAFPSAAPSTVLDLFYYELPVYSRESLQDMTSPQSQAYRWLQAHRNIHNLTEWEKKQLFALATFYYAFGGPNWPQDIRNDWLDDSKDECFWFSSKFGSFNANRLYTQDRTFEGVDPCNENGHFQALILADLALKDMQVFIPPEIELLTSLSVLALPKNELSQPLSALFPSTLYRMTNLTKINLHTNIIRGSLPTELGLLHKLVGLDFGSNRLTGTLASELGMLSHMEYVALHANKLNGTLPSQFVQCSALESAFFGKNFLSGSIPTEVGLLSNLKDFSLWKQRGLTGPIPSELGLLGESFNLLDLGKNQITGTLPSELGLLFNLTDLYLWANKLKGNLPSELGLATALTDIQIGRNQLTGTFSSALGRLSNLENLALWGNDLSGALPTELGQWSSIKSFDLGGSNLNGPLPTELGLLSNLEALKLWGNSLSGSICSEFGQWSAITHIDFSNNNLAGEIPSELGLLFNLEDSVLWGNDLSGALPTELGQLSCIKNLDLGGNALSGGMPTELGLLFNLTSLKLWENKLSGSICSEIGQLPAITHIDLSGNTLSGEMPSELGLLSTLAELMVRGNALNGTVTKALELLPVNSTHPNANGLLVLMLLEENTFTGTIPQEVCGLGQYDEEDESGFSFDCNGYLCGCDWCSCLDTNSTGGDGRK